jgi:hypothetical protein
MPGGELVTEPPPLPAVSTTRVGYSVVNVAVTLLA